MNFYRLSLYGLAVAFAAAEADAATISTLRRPASAGVGSAALSRRASFMGKGMQIGSRVKNPSKVIGSGGKHNGGHKEDDDENGRRPADPDMSGDIKDLKADVRQLTKNKADKEDVYTRMETDKAIADAVAEVKSGPGTSNIPTAPADGKEYALMASADGTKVWVVIRDEFVKNW